jgi:hypothetical protein
MNGQLWEPCPRCDTEPVCADCGYCRRHCTCADAAAEREQARAMNRDYPGLLRRVAEHLEQGAQER